MRPQRRSKPSFDLELLHRLKGKAIMVVAGKAQGQKYILDGVMDDTIQVKPYGTDTMPWVALPLSDIRLIVQCVEVEDIRADDLPMSTRALNLAFNMGLGTVGQLAKMSRRRLMRKPNVSHKTIQSIESALALYGLRLQP